MAAKTHYEVLGVAVTASAEEVREAYRRRALKLHPDRNPDDPEALNQFREAGEAYRVLSDPRLRRVYDRGFDPIESVGDLFARSPAGRRVVETMLPQAPAAPQKGLDLHTSIHVPQDVIQNGGVFPLRITRGGEEEEIMIEVPRSADVRPWCRFAQMGGPGKNNGSAGDLWISVVEEEEAER